MAENLIAIPKHRLDELLEIERHAKEVDKDWQLWLEFFYEQADFGPAHDDVLNIYYRMFEEKTGIRIDKWGES